MNHQFLGQTLPSRETIALISRLLEITTTTCVIGKTAAGNLVIVAEARKNAEGRHRNVKRHMKRNNYGKNH